MVTLDIIYTGERVTPTAVLPKILTNIQLKTSSSQKYHPLRNSDFRNRKHNNGTNAFGGAFQPTGIRVKK